MGGGGETIQPGCHDAGLTAINVFPGITPAGPTDDHSNAQPFRLRTALKKTGDPDAARELQTLAQAVLDNPEIRNAVTQ